jgi:hypothetical protein
VKIRAAASLAASVALVAIVPTIVSPAPASARAAAASAIAGSRPKPKPKPISVRPSYDRKHAVSGVIDPLEGGTLTTRGANGVRYTLTVPANTLLSPELITMTPLAAVKGLPKKGSAVAGVLLTPNGLQFLSPPSYQPDRSVLLRMRLPKAPTAKRIAKQQPLYFAGTGKALEQAPVLADSTADSDAPGTKPTDEVFVVDHFTGYTISNRIATMTPAGPTLDQKFDRITNQSRTLLQDAHAYAVAHPAHPSGDENVLARVADLADQAFDQVAVPLLKSLLHEANPTPGEMYHAMNVAEAMLRQNALVGTGTQEDADRQAFLYDTMSILIDRIMKKAVKACASKGFPAGYVRLLFGLERTRQILGIPDNDGDFAAIQKCMKTRYEVTVSGSSRIAAKAGASGDIQVSQGDDTDMAAWSATVKATVTTKTYDSDNYSFEGRGVTETTAFSPSPSPDMGSWSWDGQDADTYQQVASVTVRPDLNVTATSGKRVFVSQANEDQEDFTVTTKNGTRSAFGNGWGWLGAPTTPIAVAINGSGTGHAAHDPGGNYFIETSDFTFSVRQLS